MKYGVRAAHSIAETVVIGMVIVLVLIGMSKYVQNGLIGKWKSVSDTSFGGQFDPRESGYTEVYTKSGSTENVIRMENRTQSREPDKGDVWFQTSYQVAGSEGIVNDQGETVIRSDPERLPLKETTSRESSVSWKQFDGN